MEIDMKDPGPCSKNSIWERDLLHPRQSIQGSQSRAEVRVVRRGGEMPAWGARGREIGKVGRVGGSFQGPIRSLALVSNSGDDQHQFETWTVVGRTGRGQGGVRLGGRD